MIRRHRFFFLSALTPLLMISPAAPQEPPSHDWRGFYAGYHFGGALGLVDVDNPFGSSIFGDTVRTPGSLAGGQLGFNWQSGRGLLGLEADASFADMDGTIPASPIAASMSARIAAPRSMRSAR